MAALFSNDGAMRFNFASLPLLMCELSALWIAFRRAAIRSAGRACDRDNWSTYAFATTNCAGHSIFCWFCTFSSLTRTDFAAGDRNQRAVVRHTVLGVALRGRQLVIVRETQLVVLQTEDRIRAPLVRVVRTAPRPQATAPLVGEHDFSPIIPVRIVRIVHRIHTLGMDRVFDVEQNSISGARTRRQPNRRVHRDVVALVRVRRLLLLALLTMGATIVQAVHSAGPSIDKYPRAGHHFRVLRRSHRNLDYFDTKQRRIRVFVRLFT